MICSFQFKIKNKTQNNASDNASDRRTPEFGKEQKILKDEGVTANSTFGHPQEQSNKMPF